MKTQLRTNETESCFMFISGGLSDSFISAAAQRCFRQTSSRWNGPPARLHFLSNRNLHKDTNIQLRLMTHNETNYHKTVPYRNTKWRRGWKISHISGHEPKHQLLNRRETQQWKLIYSSTALNSNYVGLGLG